MLPSSIMGIRNRVPTITPGTLTLTSGTQAIKGTAGLTYILNTSSPGVDDTSYSMTIPFVFNMFGTNYGNNNNGGVYVSTNAFFAFGWGPGSTISLSPTLGRYIAFLNADRRAMQIGTITDSLVNGITPFRVYWYGTTFGQTSNVWIIEIIFYSNNYVQINYGTMQGTTGLQAVSNGSSNVISWNPPTFSSSSYALSCDSTGSNWVVQSGYWS